MAKRGRKPKLKPAIQFNGDVIKEVVAIVVIVMGVVALLALFNAGGKVGLTLKTIFLGSLGVAGYVMPLVLMFLGYLLLTPDFFAEPKRKRGAIGVSIGIVILLTMLNHIGGSIGRSLFDALAGLVGKGSYFILVALLLIDLILTFEMSIRPVLDLIKSRLTRGDDLPDNIKVLDRNEEPRVSVFTTVRRKIGGGKGQPPIASEKQMPLISGNDKAWEFPSLELLDEKGQQKASSGNIAKNMEAIKKSLADFSIDVEMGDVSIGPTVTQYQLKPIEGVKLTQITARADDLALALAAHPLRVEAPIPNKSAVGIEVPNKVTARVSLKELFESKAYKTAESNLTLTLGLDVAGAVIAVDLKKLPHMLIAGATGSGKSVCISALIFSLLYRNSPSTLRMILVDPKRVEFTHYNGIPHLLAPVVVDVDKTVNVLKWAVAEMERRFKVFQEIGVRNLESYNEAVKKGGNSDNQTMPNIVIIIDELADLMVQAANEVETAIVRLAQMARATGIHLIVATQRPSVNVITGLIKANIPARIAFKVASQIDSRTILDQAGAEKLLGAGDMLFSGGEATKPKRIQGPLVTDREINAVTDFLKRHGHAIYDTSVTEFKTDSSGRRGGGGDDGGDAMYKDAKQVVIQAGKASASLLQRRLKVGYARAARLLDILEDNGVIGPADGAKPREVYVTTMEVDEAPQSSNDYRVNNQTQPEPPATSYQENYNAVPVVEESAYTPAEVEEEATPNYDNAINPQIDPQEEIGQKDTDQSQGSQF